MVKKISLTNKMTETSNSTFNSSSVMDVLMSTTLPPFLQDIIDNLAVSESVFYLLILLYSLIIFGSVVGNVLVITAVLRSPNMRKANNVLIVNLAVSDLLLCTVVSPLTLIEIMHKRWMGPKLQWICRLSGMVPCCATYISTLTITGIAIDRYKVIVYSGNNRSSAKMSTTIITLIFIWSISALCSSPLLFAMSLKVIPMPPPVVAMVGDTSIAYCAEEWGEYKRGRMFFSIFSLLVQFILPITLISFAHYAIKKKLQKLPSWRPQKEKSICTSITKKTTLKRSSGSEEKDDANDGGNPVQKLSGSWSAMRKSTKRTKASSDGNVEISDQLNSRLQDKLKRQARTHFLLVSIVVVFALSWFPLNTLNLILDIHNIFQNEEMSRICFAFCHLIGMSSAFSNPILYGWFNDSFKEEFQNIGRSLICGCFEPTPHSVQTATDVFECNIDQEDRSCKRRRIISLQNQERTLLDVDKNSRRSGFHNNTRMDNITQV